MTKSKSSSEMSVRSRIISIVFFLATMLALYLFLVVVVRQRVSLSEEQPVSDISTPSAIPGSLGAPTSASMNQETCLASGGHWNECGSACRNLAPDAACIELCVPQCECGGVAGWSCPSGATCLEYEPLPRTASSVGVCRFSEE